MPVPEMEAFYDVGVAFFTQLIGITSCALSPDFFLVIGILSFVYLSNKLLCVFDTGDIPDLSPFKTVHVGTCGFAAMYCQDQVDLPISIWGEIYFFP